MQTNSGTTSLTLIMLIHWNNNFINWNLFNFNIRGMHLLLKTVNYVQWYPYLPSISQLACREGFLLNCYIVQWGKTDSCLSETLPSGGWLNFWLMIILHVLVDICYIWWFRISWILRLEFMKVKVKVESGLLEMPWISLPIVRYYIVVSNWQFAKSDCTCTVAWVTDAWVTL